MTDPHPRILHAFLGNIARKDANEIKADFQTLLEWIDRNAGIDPHYDCLRHMLDYAINHVDDWTIRTFRYEFNTDAPDVAIFSIWFEPLLYETITGTPYDGAPVIRFTIRPNTAPRLIAHQTPGELFATFYDSVDTIQPRYHIVDLAIIYLFHVRIPIIPTEITGAFLEGDVREFTVTTKDTTHEIYINITRLRAFAVAIKEFTKEFREANPSYSNSTAK